LFIFRELTYVSSCFLYLCLFFFFSILDVSKFDVLFVDLKIWVFGSGKKLSGTDTNLILGLIGQDGTVGERIKQFGTTKNAAEESYSEWISGAGSEE